MGARRTLARAAGQGRHRGRRTAGPSGRGRRALAGVPLRRDSRDLAFIRTQLKRGGALAFARADLALDRAQALTDEFEINVYLPELHECRARLALARGDAATGQRELDQARQCYENMGATIQLDRLAKEFA